MNSQPIRGADEYVSGQYSFLAGARPQDVVALPIDRVLELLRRRFGTGVDVAMSKEATDVSRPIGDLPEVVRSPLYGREDTSWMRHTNMVGVNVRTVGDYAGVVKYALTLPRAFDSIHLLPVWEPGVIESLYGIASWNFNTEFFSEEWHRSCPQLDSAGRQLRAVSNLIHLMGKVIGMDVIPHTDRFSEAAVGTPSLFEWMRVADDRIVDKSEALHERAEEAVHRWLAERGPAAHHAPPVPSRREELFALPEQQRLLLLFGEPGDQRGRTERRVELIRHLKGLGLEPVPATMGVPFRGLEVDASNVVVDDHGMRWPDYRITNPHPMSRVFSPLARFKLYGRLDDNANWEIDFSNPRQHVWDYVISHYAKTRHVGNFDFMRGDMSHVQMRPGGVPARLDDHYDILAMVKAKVRTEVPWFAYFAESFLPPRDVFQYGEELDHLEASLADATLGDLQSTVVGSPEFLQRFRRYLDDLATRSCAPSFSVGTADKDDPRFDEYFRHGLLPRFFTALFLTDMPSYVGLGFEIRDEHEHPVENERYTKLFVFKAEGDTNVFPSKARFSDEFVWGDNQSLFARVTELRELAEQILPQIDGTKTRWLLPPDATGNRAVAAWTQWDPDDSSYVFMVNYDNDADVGPFGIPGLNHSMDLELVYSSSGAIPTDGPKLIFNGLFHRVEGLDRGECRVYELPRPQGDRFRHPHERR